MSYSMYPGPRRRVYSNGQVVLIVVVAGLLILGCGLLVYTTVNNSTAAINASSTATAQTAASRAAVRATSNAVVSSDTATAQVALTSLAQAGITATAQAYGHATATTNAQASATAAARATSIARANASATAQTNATRDPYPPYTGALSLNDPLYNNSQGHGWDVYSLPIDNNCQFAGGGYEVTQQNQNAPDYDISNSCIAEKTNFANFTFQVDMTLMKGDCGGLEFRGDDKGIDGYAFVVCALATQITPASYWSFRLMYSFDYVPLAQAFSSAIHTGYGQTNVLAVVAIGHSLTFYANGQKLATVTNLNYNTGEIGVMVSGIPGVQTDAMFRNVEVWTM